MANFYSVKDLPGKGEPGSAYALRKPGGGFDIYIAIADGTLIDLASLLQPRAPLAVGPQGLPGKDGRDGVDGKLGRDGSNGRDGRHGTDGKDGRDGIDGKPGLQGPKGEPGDLTTVGDPELLAANKQLKEREARALAVIAERLGRRDSPSARGAAAHLRAVMKELLS